MSTNYHTPVAVGAAVTSANVNAPIATLDDQLTTLAAIVSGLESEIADARGGKETLIANIDTPIDTPVEKGTPAGAGDTGQTGQMSWDANYLYVCVDIDTWKRVTLENWS